MSGVSRRNNQTNVEGVEIPYPVRVGQTVQLRCIWNIGVTGFYALRWYKDEERFYSYLRGGEPTIHDLQGARVTVNVKNVSVINIDLLTIE